MQITRMKQIIKKVLHKITFTILCEQSITKVAILNALNAQTISTVVLAIIGAF